MLIQELLIDCKDCTVILPKNSGLKKYREIAISYLKNIDPAKILEVRGEDVSFWVKELRKKGKKAIGLTGEDLYREYCLEEREYELEVIKRIDWQDKEALFGKPTLCLLGSKDMEFSELPRNLTVCIAAKYARIAKKYLNLLERRGYVFKKIYVSGCVETSCQEGIADLVIDIVYTGSSLEKYRLNVYDKILQSDFLIISNSMISGGKNDQ